MTKPTKREPRDPWTPRMRRAAALRAAGKKWAQVAAAIGVREQTARTYALRPGWRELVGEHVLGEARDLLTRSLLPAIESLRRIALGWRAGERPAAAVLADVARLAAEGASDPEAALDAIAEAIGHRDLSAMVRAAWLLLELGDKRLDIFGTRRREMEAAEAAAAPAELGSVTITATIRRPLPPRAR